ncbi:MAG: DUF2092 domain-containing protein, partial [bacterium]
SIKLGLLVAAGCFLSFQAMAETSVISTGAPAEKVTGAKIDPAVDKVLKALAENVQGLKRFRCDVNLLMTSEMEGMKQEITTTYSFAMERPNKLALRHVRGLAGNTIICDGKQLVTLASALNRYEQQDAPKDFEVLFQGAGPLAGSMLFLDSLLRADVRAAICEGVVEASYVGKEPMEGRECDRLKFSQEEFEWELWVTTGEKPVVLCVRSDMSKSFPAAGAQVPAGKGMKMTVLNRMSGWQLNPELPEDAFVFKAPEGAKKTASLFEGEDEEPLDLPVNVLIKHAPEAPKDPVVAATNAVKEKGE